MAKGKPRRIQVAGKRYEKELREGVDRIKREFGLSDEKAAQLIGDLRNLTAIAFIKDRDENKPVSGAVLRELEGIWPSVRRIAAFAKAGAGHPLEPERGENPENAAYALLLSQANEWVKGKDLDTLERFGLDKVEAGLGRNISAVDRWLKSASLMAELIKGATRRLQENQTARKVVPQVPRVAYLCTDNGDMPFGPIETTFRNWLIGEKLPALYTETTGKKYGIFKSSDQVQDETGVRFVRLAIEAMGLGQIKPETVASYQKNARRPRKQSASSSSFERP